MVKVLTLRAARKNFFFEGLPTEDDAARVSYYYLSIPLSNEAPLSAKLKLQPSYSSTSEPKSPKTDGKNRRRLPKLLVYPRFQLLLIGSNLVILLTAFIGFWITSQEIIQGLTPAATLSGVEVEFFQRYLAYQESQFRLAYLVAVALAIAVSGGVTLILSHRIAGPILRLKNFLRSITRNEKTPPLTFRDGDFLSDLPTLVNDAVDILRQRK